MKQDTQDMKPLRKLLKGKVPTRQQYTNWITPVRNTYNKYASIIFSFFAVFFVYSDQNLYSTVNADMFIDLGAKYYRDVLLKKTRKFVACTSTRMSLIITRHNHKDMETSRSANAIKFLQALLENSSCVHV